MRTRNILIVVHRWVALIAGLFIFLVAISGGALVFEGAIDRALHPGLWRVTPGDRWVSLDSMLATARSAVAGPPPAAITLPAAPDRAATVQVGTTQVFINPYTGAVLGQRTGAEGRSTLASRLHQFHIGLFSGSAGREIVGATSALALFLVVTGVIVWWREKSWRVRWSASWKRVIFDLHHSLGIFAAVVLTLITMSGVFIHYDSLAGALRKLDSSPPAAAPKQPIPASASAAISVDSLYRVASTALPGARVSFLTFSPKTDAPSVAAMRFPEDRTPAGRSRVYVDRFSGAVLLTVSTRNAQIGTRISNNLRPIHTGDIFGGPTEMIWLAAAIVLASQAVTGVTMWFNGRKARQALARNN